MQNHANLKKKHMCDFCEYRNNHGANMRLHMMTHMDKDKDKMNEKRLKCEYCNFSFNIGSAGQRHSMDTAL